MKTPSISPLIPSAIGVGRALSGGEGELRSQVNSLTSPLSGGKVMCSAENRRDGKHIAESILVHE
ncbi:MAG: hypothetical protein UW94_C0002G0038 [Parcubacteria group bacterium GW2011_GWA2_45_14]|nr:MAG: hypothetical protein UW94_C0002G0038 [Parcubacteria group bacterium GW2011_GWA2_45_14]